MKKPVPTFDDITGCLSRKSEHYPDKGAGEPRISWRRGRVVASR